MRCFEIHLCSEEEADIGRGTFHLLLHRRIVTHS